MTRFGNGLAIGLVMLAPALVRADTLDQAMAQNSAGLVEQLQTAGYANVGVLKGELQTGGDKGPVVLAPGKMAELMATRLENLLILGLDPAKPIGITRNASATAHKANREATFATPEGRAALFQTQYPLAWGKKTVKVNAFLVPRIILDSKLENYTLSVQLFTEADAKTLKSLKLENATHPITRQLMIDLDQPFVVPASLFRKRGGDGDLRDEFPAALDRAIQTIKVKAPNDPGNKQPELIKPAPVPMPMPKPQEPNDLDWVEKTLEFKAFYDKKPVERLTPNRLPNPKPGQNVYFTLKSKERLGIVMLVNGINTADYDRVTKESTNYVKWVLEKDISYMVRGYYGQDKVYAFEVASSKAAAKELLAGLGDSNRYGVIDLHIYKEVEGGGVTDVRTGPSLRADVEPAESLEALQMNIRVMAAKNSKPVKKSFLVPGEGIDKTLESTAFEGVLAAKLQIRYAE